MISHAAEYALRAMVLLANDAPRAASAHDIALRAAVPTAHMAKVFLLLRRAGLLTARRGVEGRTNLTRPPEEISLLQIVSAADGAYYVDLPKGKDGIAMLELKWTLDSLRSQFREKLADVSLADVASKETAKLLGDSHSAAPHA